MKILIPLILISALLGNSKLESNPKSIGKGQMPSLAADKMGKVHLVYGSGDSLLYAVSNDKGSSFTKATLIKVIDGLAANATRGPQIAITKNGLSVVASTDEGNIWSFTKNNQGEWSKGTRVNDVDSVNLEGFVDVASDGRSNVFAVWLDLRKTKRNKLYGARSFDGGKTWSPNIKVYESPDSTICECCRVSVAMKEQNVFVMFRNQLFGKRDLHIITSKDGGRTFNNPEKLGMGTWVLKGCPMDGGNLTLTPNGKIQTVWRRESKIFSCEPGEQEVEIGEGKACTITNAGGGNVYAWVKNGEVICKLPSGSVKNLGKGNSPSLVSIGNDEVICVWENENHLFSSKLTL